MIKFEMLLKQTCEFLLLNKSATSFDNKKNFLFWSLLLLNEFSGLNIYFNKFSTFFSIKRESPIN